MSDVQRLAVAVLGFLNEQLRAGTLSEDATESLEVATQCLETAFGVSAADSHLAVSRPLLDIFVEATQDEPASNPPLSQEKALPDCTVSEEDRTRADKYKNEGNQCMREERYSEAVECYTHAIELHQQNAVYFCNRAAAYSKLNNYVGAVQDCERAIVIDPNYSKAYGRMGLALTSLGKHEEAVEFYRRAVELDPDNEGYRGNLELAESRGREATSPNATPGGFDLAGILNNPGFMAMAANMMQNPQLQQMMSGMMSGGFSGGVPGVGTGGINDMAGLIQAGQQFAQTMQQENPELIEQLRSQIRSRPASASHDDLPPPYQPPPPPPPQPPSS